MNNYEEMTFSEFMGSEWSEVDANNIPIDASLDLDDKRAVIKYAHPRKMRMSQITITDVNWTQLEKWWDNAKTVNHKLFVFGKGHTEGY